MKKIVVCVTAFVTMLAIALTAFASDSAQSISDYASELAGFTADEAAVMLENYTKYQEILDRLSGEYGMTVRFCTAEEMERLGMSVPSLTMTAQEFEATMRDYVEETLKSNTQTVSGRSAGIKYVCESLTHTREGDTNIYTGNFIRTTSEESETVLQVTAEETYYSMKDVEGGAVSIGGTVTNASGYWQFKSISDWAFVTNVYLHGNILFEPSTVSYELIDMRRTCAVSMSGRTYNHTTGATVESSAARYAEFSANNNEYDGD